EPDTLLKQAIVCWVKVADGFMSPLLALWICNNAMQGVRQNVYEYASEMVPLFDHKNLMWMWEGLYPEVGEDDEDVESDSITSTDADCEGDFALP
ncbi:MAG: hypothetical protein M1835_003798, partial [Candelina submexicana]